MKHPYFPVETTRYDLWNPPQIEVVGHAPYKLAKASEQFLEWLRWPTQVSVDFLRPMPSEDWQYDKYTPLEVPHMKTLHLSINAPDPVDALYNFDMQIMTDGKHGIVDAAQYDLAQVTYQDFMIPWVVAVKSMSRVLFPRRRSHVPADLKKYQRLHASAAMHAIASKLIEIRQGVARPISLYHIDGKSFTDEELRTTYVEN